MENRSIQLSLQAERYLPLSLLWYFVCPAYMLFPRERCCILISLSSNIHNRNQKSITGAEPERSELQGRARIRLKQIFL